MAKLEMMFLGLVLCSHFDEGYPVPWSLGNCYSLNTRAVHAFYSRLREMFAIETLLCMGGVWITEISRPDFAHISFRICQEDNLAKKKKIKSCSYRSLIMYQALSNFTFLVLFNAHYNPLMHIFFSFLYRKRLGFGWVEKLSKFAQLVMA